MNYIQQSLFGDGGGFTIPESILIEMDQQQKQQRKLLNVRKSNEINISIDLNLPLFPSIDSNGIDTDEPIDIIYDARHEWVPPPKPNETTAKEAWKALPDKGRNTEFSTPTEETIAFIAAKLLYTELHILANSRGNAEVKQDILDWLFASQFFIDGKPVKKSMRFIPFTAQFCCAVEEIDYDLLCEVIQRKLK